MKYIYVSLLFCVFYIGSTHAQDSQNNFPNNLIVVDSLTKKPIGYANFIVNKRLILIAAPNGIIHLSQKEFTNRDTVKISCVGYQSQYFRGDLLYKRSDTIYMHLLATDLSEVTINYVRSVPISIGMVNRHDLHPWPLWAGEVLVKYFPNDKHKLATLKSLEFLLNNSAGGIKRPFTIEMYTRSRDSIFPSHKLFDSSLVVNNPKGKSIISVDVSNCDITIPSSGFMVVIKPFADPSDEKHPFSGFPSIDCERLDIYSPFDPNFNPPKDTSYSMYRVNDGEWTLFRGGNFAIGATIF